MEALIKETYTLPSLGKVYEEEINPEITLRSMTMEEEMKRLGHSERPNKLMSEIIDACMVGDKPKISSYDMCLADYNYLFHKLRTVTYGNECDVTTYCPYCGGETKTTINLDGLQVTTYTEDLDKYLNVKLPVSGYQVELHLQTPRDIDDITLKKKDWTKKHPDFEGDPAILFNLMSLIKTIDGERLTEAKLETVIRKMHMKDINYILRCAEKSATKLGVQVAIDITCKECGLVYTNSFRPNADFFGPEIDI